MENFLNKLHKKPDHHKKMFALLSSATITLFIFGIWSLANFGISDQSIVATNSDSSDQVNTSSEVSPIQSIRMSLASSFEALKSSFGELKNSVKSIDLESEYLDMRDGALETYGE